MSPLDFFRFGPLAILAMSIPMVIPMPRPQQPLPAVQNRFAFPQAPAVNFNSPSTQIAGLGALGTGIFAASNIASGNDQISINPNVGFNFNPETGALTPAVTANVQVGDGPVAPSFNVGGQFDPNSNSGIPIAPVVGTGLNFGDGNGGFRPGVTSNFALQNGQANAQFGAGANVGGFQLGSLGGFFGRRR